MTAYENRLAFVRFCEALPEGAETIVDVKLYIGAQEIGFVSGILVNYSDVSQFAVLHEDGSCGAYFNLGAVTEFKEQGGSMLHDRPTLDVDASAIRDTIECASDYARALAAIRQIDFKACTFEMRNVGR